MLDTGHEKLTGTHIFSGMSGESPAAAIAAALAQLVTHIENGASLQIALVEVMQEGAQWRAVLRVTVTPAARPAEREDDKRKPAPEKTKDGKRPAGKPGDNADAAGSAAALALTMAEAEFEDALARHGMTADALAGDAYPAPAGDITDTDIGAEDAATEAAGLRPAAPPADAAPEAHPE
jgi:hypothetical protein